GKTLSCFQFDAVTGVNTQQINALATETQWTVRGENVLIFGASGLGKTHLASSLGYSLIEAGIRVQFISATSLVQELQLAKQRYSLADAFGKLDKYAVLILDDLGYVKKTDQETSVLFELIAVSAGVILTHPVGVNLTHLGNDGGFLATDNVDSGASSGDQVNGAS